MLVAAGYELREDGMVIQPRDFLEQTLNWGCAVAKTIE